MEFIRGQVRILTTEAGERPGAKRGLMEAGVRLEAGQVRLCILRGDTWVWRSGRVDWVWIPDTSLLRSGLSSVCVHQNQIKTNFLQIWKH